jgi:hypothetical protein
MKKAVLLIIVVCVIITAIVLKCYDSAFVTRNAVAQAHSETQKYDNQTSASQQANIQFIIDEKETPFLAKFRKLYESADLKTVIVLVAVSSCNHKKIEFNPSCTDKDIKKMEELAEQGDYFSLAVLAEDLPVKGKPWREKALAAGEPVFTVRFAMRPASQENIDVYKDRAEKQLIALKAGYPFFGITSLLDFYERTDQKNKFCKTAEDAYNEFGIFALSKYFSDEEMYGNFLFSNCDLFGKDRATDNILKELHIDEATLVLGYRYVMLEKYKEAASIFERFYSGDDTLFSINAGYCLGIMHYYGKGYPVDKNKGIELLLESYNKGNFKPSVLKMNKLKLLPVADSVIKDTGNFCSRIEERNQ